jgi:AbrB family looped-hinge helix DNA binding protein
MNLYALIFIGNIMDGKLYEYSYSHRRERKVTIPKEIREMLGLKPAQSLVVDVRKQEIILKPAVQYEEFFSQLRERVRGSKIKPSEIKEIWGIANAHH